MKKYALWLIVIIAIAGFFRLWDLKNTPPGLWADEAVNGVNAIEAIGSHDWRVFYPENFGREGLFINIQSIFVKFLGTEPWVLRLPSAIFGILTVLGLYFLASELFGTRVGLFAAFFLATSFWHINFSRIGFRAIMAPFFLVWSFYFLFLIIRRSVMKPSPPPPSIIGRGENRNPISVLGWVTNWFLRPEILFTVAGLLFGLGLHTYIAYRIAPLIVLLPLWWLYKNWKKEVRLQSASDGNRTSGYCAPCLIVLFVIMAVLAASPLLLYYAQNPADFFGRTAGISVFQSENPIGQFSENFVKTIQMFNFFGDFNWRHNYAGAPQLWWPIGILFLIGLIWSVKYCLKFAYPYPSLRSGRTPTHTNFIQQIADPFPYKFILLWFVIMLLPVAISNEGLPHALRAIVLIPPAMIFAALGLEYIIGRSKLWLDYIKNKYYAVDFQTKRIEKELGVFLLTFFIATAVHTYNTYFLKWAFNPNVSKAFQSDITEKAVWLKNQSSNIKKYIVTGETDSIDLTGRPMSLQPMVFITNTFFEKDQKEKNIYYRTAPTEHRSSNELSFSDCVESCIIIPLETNTQLYRAIKQKIPGLVLDGSPGFIILRK